MHSKLNTFNLHSIKKFLVLSSLAVLTACGGNGEVISLNGYPLVVNVSGLKGSSVLLKNDNGIDRGGDRLLVSKDGNFSFSTLIPQGGKYLVRVKSQPDGQVCTVNNGSGVGSPNMSVVNVICSAIADAYVVKGLLSGLLDRHYIVLSNNTTDVLTLTENGAFQFPQLLARGSRYTVAIETYPEAQNCTLTNEEGPVSADMPKVIVNCGTVPDEFTIGGTVTGLAQGDLVLNNRNSNGGVVDTLTINTASPGFPQFVFGNKVVFNGYYNVTVAKNPAGQICTPSQNTGNNVVQNITTVVVNCVDENKSFRISGTLSGLDAGQTITLLNNGADEITLDSNKTFQFPTKVGIGDPYKVTITNNGYPFLQQCEVINGSGTVKNAPVNDVQVNCSVAPVSVYQSFPNNAAGYYPVALIRNDDGTFYGMTTTTIIRNDNNNDKTGYLFYLTSGRVIQYLHPLEGNGGTRPPFYFDPAFPTGIMRANDGNLYGNTYLAGSNYVGAIYTLDTVSNLFEQNAASFPASNQGPVADLIQGNGVDNNLYGITYGDILIQDRINGGSVFERNYLGEVTPLHTFTFADASTYGVRPVGRLLLVGNDLYGTTEMGGKNGRGTIFAIKTDGSGFKVIAHFEAGGSFPTHRTEDRDKDSPGIYSDPYALPYSGLMQATDGKLYGVAKYGGEHDGGRIFKVDLNKADDDKLSTHYSFVKRNGYPIFELLQLKDGKLYGTTQGDGTRNNGGDGGEPHDTIYKGTIFRIALDDKAPLEILHSFTGIRNGGDDGDRPVTRLISDGENLYGATRFGGRFDRGMIYKFGRK